MKSITDYTKEFYGDLGYISDEGIHTQYIDSELIETQRVNKAIKRLVKKIRKEVGSK